MLEELFAELENLMTIWESVKETKNKSVYMGTCPNTSLFFIFEHIPDSGTDLINVVSSSKLKCTVIPQFKSLNQRKGTFIGPTKEVIELEARMDEHHHLVGLKDDKMVSAKKTPEERASKKAVEEVSVGEKTNSSFEFVDVFDVESLPHGLRNLRRSLSRIPKF